MERCVECSLSTLCLSCGAKRAHLPGWVRPTHKQHSLTRANGERKKAHIPIQFCCRITASKSIQFFFLGSLLRSCISHRMGFFLFCHSLSPCNGWIATKCATQMANKMFYPVDAIFSKDPREWEQNRGNNAKNMEEGWRDGMPLNNAKKCHLLLCRYALGVCVHVKSSSI